MTPAQCRAGRALLSWTQADLARRAKVGIVTVRQYELGAGAPREATLSRMRAAFGIAGVTLDLDAGAGPGVRFLRDEATNNEDSVETDPLPAAMMLAIAALERDDLTEEEQDEILDAALAEGLEPARELGLASDHPNTTGPATDAIKRMEAEIAGERGEAEDLKRAPPSR